MKEHHLPVLKGAFLSFFENRQIKIFIDGTIGAGGHSKALLEAHPEIELLIGLDQDTEALAIAENTLEKYKQKVKLIHGNFRDLKRLVDCENVDGILLDIGVSSMQLDMKEKGFSFLHDGPLDMRMDPSSNSLTAKKVINTLSEKKLADIFWEYGEEKRSRQAAAAICAARVKNKIETTKELAEVLAPVLTWSGRRGKHMHPLALVFQALRIYVNDELGAIEEALPQAIDLLASGGRLGVISFHSLEDRIVKNIFRDLAHAKKVQLLTKKPLAPTPEEEKVNPRSRSSKLRFVEKR